MIVKAQNNQRNKLNIRLVSEYFACKIKIAVYLSLIQQFAKILQIKALKTEKFHLQLISLY